MLVHSKIQVPAALLKLVIQTLTVGDKELNGKISYVLLQSNEKNIGAYNFKFEFILDVLFL